MNNPYNLSIESLEKKAKELRLAVIDMLEISKSGHTGGSLGAADLFAALYFSLLKYDPNDPKNDERDRLVLSYGHICPILYTTLSYSGFFPLELLKRLRQLDSPLEGHPHYWSVPGVENSSGPLGQGISQAVGMALRAKIDKKNYRVICLVSDGEMQEGQCWEALLFASAKRLDNLVIVVDKNNIQIDGYVQDIETLEPFESKMEAFNANVFQMDGNSMHDVVYTMNKAFNSLGARKMSIVVSTTILGAGVPFMENVYDWHGKAPTPEEAQRARSYLKD